MSTRTPFVPPPLFTLGLGLTGALQLFYLLFLCIGTAAAALGISAAALSEGGKDGLAMLFFGGLATGAVLLLLIGFSLFTLLAVTKAWTGSRGWTITVLVLSALSLADFGCLSTPIAILTLIGCIQVLNQTSDRARVDQA